MVLSSEEVVSSPSPCLLLSASSSSSVLLAATEESGARSVLDSREEESKSPFLPGVASSTDGEASEELADRFLLVRSRERRGLEDDGGGGISSDDGDAVEVSEVGARALLCCCPDDMMASAGKHFQMMRSSFVTAASDLYEVWLPWKLPPNFFRDVSGLPNGPVHLAQNVREVFLR